MTRGLLVVLLAIGCSPSARSEGAGPQSAARPAADDPTCPMLVPGTSVAVEDTDQGGALVFVTTGDVAAVRTRAAALVKMHEDHQALVRVSSVDAAPNGARGPMAMGQMIATQSEAVAGDVPSGARVVFTAVHPEDVARLQVELRMHVRHLAAGSCEMKM